MKGKSRTMKSKSGFTLVEIMIVVAIIGLLAAIALSNFIRARQTSQATMCSQNLERIDGAKVQAAFEYNLGDADTPTDLMLAEFLGKPLGTPIDGTTQLCPAKGVLSVNPLWALPSCTLAAGPGMHQVE
jgi:prepilin-type N-terminal cleavage/methylation domain-containing protein